MGDENRDDDKRWAQLARDVKDLIVFENLHPVGDANCLPVDLSAVPGSMGGPWNQCWLDCAERVLAELLRRRCRELGLWPTDWAEVMAHWAGVMAEIGLSPAEVVAPPTGGTFTITACGRTSPPLAHDASREEIGVAVKALFDPPPPGEG